MKKNEPTGLTFSTVFKVVTSAFHSLFFAENRDFQRLKNFIAS